MTVKLLNNVFAAYLPAAYPFRFAGTLTFTGEVHGGTPGDPKVAEKWLASKGVDSDSQIRQTLLEVIAEHDLDPADIEGAAKIAVESAHVNRFKRDPGTGLYLEGRHLKANIKEAVVVAAAAGHLANRGWGAYSASPRNFAAEHLFVEEQRLYLMRGGKHVTEPDGIHQRFCHTFQGSSIKYEEYVEGCQIDFTILTDWGYTEADFAMIFSKAGQQGLGAARSQGFGTYVVTRWEPQTLKAKKPITTSAKMKAKAA